MIITFLVSRRRREMYIGHGRLCVCLSLAAFTQYCTDPDLTWGMMRRRCGLTSNYFDHLLTMRW